ncbi:MAG: hypothetical protein JSW58_04015 [Candidatus Latescibacterota bacterium]|nr:MAG: hypothetical protein JSW58_04015 [Candidatus Latescibacterota bacterium]
MNTSIAIFLHDHRYDRLYQAVSISLAATSMGWSCHLFMFYQALASYIDGTWDDIRAGDRAERPGQDALGSEPGWMTALRKGFDTSNIPSLYEMLERSRSGEGELKVYGCSASVKLLGLNLDDVRKRVDEVVGLPTMLAIAGNATHALYI